MTRLSEFATSRAELLPAFELANCPIYFQMLVPVGTEQGSGRADGAVDRESEMTDSAATAPGETNAVVPRPPVVVNEIAVRLGGAYEDQSIPLVTGIDILTRQLTAVRDAVLRGGYETAGCGAARVAGLTAGGTGARRAGPPATGTVSTRGTVATPPPSRPPHPPEPLSPPSPASQAPSPRSSASPQHVSSYFAVPLMFAHPGTVARLEGDAELRRVPGVADCRFLLPEGTVIRPMENSTQRIAYAVLHADSVSAINTLVDTLFDRLRVLSPDGTNLLMDTRDDIRR